MLCIGVGVAVAAVRTKAGFTKPAKHCAEVSPLGGSNPRPYAYEAHALPAELRRLSKTNAIMYA